MNRYPVIDRRIERNVERVRDGVGIKVHGSWTELMNHSGRCGIHAVAVLVDAVVGDINGSRLDVGIIVIAVVVKAGIDVYFCELFTALMCDVQCFVLRYVGTDV